MAEQLLSDFMFHWEKSFPGEKPPEDLEFLGVLKCSSKSDEMKVAVERDLISLNNQRQTMKKRLDEVQYCISWIHRAKEAEAEMTNGKKIATEGNDVNHQNERNKNSEGESVTEPPHRDQRSSSLAGENVKELFDWERRRGSDGNACAHITKEDIMKIEADRPKSPYVNVTLSHSATDLRNGSKSPKQARRRRALTGTEGLTSYISDKDRPHPMPPRKEGSKVDEFNKSKSRLARKPSDLIIDALTRSRTNSDSDCGSPMASPSATPSREAFLFGISALSDYRPPSGGSASEQPPGEFRRFVLVSGQRMDVIGLHGQGTVDEQYVARNESTEVGLVPKERCYVDYEATPLLWQKEWFATSAVENHYKELLVHAPTGTFYVRHCKSKADAFSLVVKTVQSSTKYQITVDKSRYTICTRCSGRRTFSSLDELITFFKTHSLTVDSQTNICLTIPCKRLEAAYK